MDLVSGKSPGLTCPACPGALLEGRRTREGTLYVCPRCQGRWDPRQHTSLTPLLTQALEQRSRWTHEGLCSRGQHPLRPPDEHCFQCPEATHRCPACAARLFVSEPRGQPLEVCPRCPGLWLGPGVWESLRQEPASASLAVGLGAGGALRRGRPSWPGWAVGLLAGTFTLLVTGALEGLLRWLWAFFRGG